MHAKLLFFFLIQHWVIAVHPCRAATNCDLFVLTKTDLDRALTYYPHIEDQIRKVAGNRANLVKKRSQIAAKAAAEGKSASDAAKEAAQGTKGEEDEDGGDKPSKTPAPTASGGSEPADKKPAAASAKEEVKKESVEKKEDEG